MVVATLTRQPSVLLSDGGRFTDWLEPIWAPFVGFDRGFLPGPGGAIPSDPAGGLDPGARMPGVRELRQ